MGLGKRLGRRHGGLNDLYISLRMNRLFAASGAPHIALEPGVIEGSRAVDGRQIVPDHHIAKAPFMAIDKLRLGGESHQLIQQGAGIVSPPTNNA